MLRDLNSSKGLYAPPHFNIGSLLRKAASVKGRVLILSQSRRRTMSYVNIIKTEVKTAREESNLCSEKLGTRFMGITVQDYSGTLSSASHRLAATIYLLRIIPLFVFLFSCTFIIVPKDSNTISSSKTATKNLS